MLRTLSIAFLTLTSCAINDENPAEIPDDSVETETPKEEEEQSSNDPSDPSDFDACRPNKANAGMRFDGKVEYEDGTVANPNNTIVKMCCTGGCQTAEWGVKGFCFNEGRLEPGKYAFKVMPFGVENHATPLTFVTVGEENIALEQPIMIPKFENRAEVQDGIFYAGNGLEVNVVAEAFVSGLGDDYIAAVDVEPATSGLPLENVDAEKVVGIWYMGSFDTDLFPKWTFQLHDTDLPVGTQLTVLNSSYSDREWVHSGTATVGEDGVVRADLESGISTLSTLILIEQ